MRTMHAHLTGAASNVSAAALRVRPRTKCTTDIAAAIARSRRSRSGNFTAPSLLSCYGSGLRIAILGHAGGADKLINHLSCAGTRDPAQKAIKIDLRLLRLLIDDEQRGADLGVRAMWLRVVGYLIAHPRAQRKDAAVSQLGVELALRAKKDVTLDAPVISEIARRVLHHAYADPAEDSGAPKRHAALASMLRALDLRPVGCAKRYGGHVHEAAYRSRSA